VAVRICELLTPRTTLPHLVYSSLAVAAAGSVFRLRLSVSISIRTYERGRSDGECDLPIMNIPIVTKSIPILLGLPLRWGLGLSTSTSIADSSAAMMVISRKNQLRLFSRKVAAVRGLPR
jgi:hypothetical protein